MEINYETLCDSLLKKSSFEEKFMPELKKWLDKEKPEESVKLQKIREGFKKVQKATNNNLNSE